MKEYDLLLKVQNKYVYMRIIKEMYGLPQDGMLSNKLLKECLQKHWYYELIYTTGLFTHKTIVDDLGVKHVGKEHAEQLKLVLCSFYEV